MNAKLTKKYVQMIVKDILKRCNGVKRISVFHDYTILHHEFKRPYSEKQLENKLNCWFCNSMNHDVTKVALVYSAYEGFLSIIPLENDSNSHHESYFNFDGDPIDIENVEKWDNRILKMWTKLTKL